MLCFPHATVAKVAEVFKGGKELFLINLGLRIGGGRRLAASARE